MLKHAAITVGLPITVLVAAGCASTDLETATTKAATQGQSIQGQAAQARDTDFLEQYASTFRFRLGTPSRVTITPQGDQILFLRSGPRSFTQNLYAHDPATGEETLLLSAADLLGGQEEELSVEELARRERTRSAARGIASFRLSKDGSTILVPLSGDLYLVDRATMEIDRIPTSDDDLGSPIDPKLSDDGSTIACVRDGDLYVIDVATKQHSRLTTTASETITNATAEFVAQEEMGRRSGYWWSPDGKFIAYQENDETEVETLSIMDPKNPGKAPNTWRYPRAGTPNATVRLGVISAGGENVWIDWDRERYPYLITVKWPENAPLTILVQNRHQTEEALLAIDHTTGEATTLLVERDDQWLKIDQSFPHWLDDGSAFLWATERNGAWQIERRARSGNLDRILNSVDAGLLGMAHVDEDDGLIYVTATNDPTQRHLGTLLLDGPSDQQVTMLTELPGNHRATFSEESDLIVHTISPASTGTQRLVRELDGEALGPVLSELRSVAEAPSFTPSPEWVRTDTSPEMYAVVIRPRGYDPSSRYPVILHVYGGPTSQMVTRSRDRYRLQQWMADQGYIVVSIDGRGTPARGRDWQRVTKGNLIDIPLEDQVAGLRALGNRFSEMDLSRVGVFGWSFGGYFSAMAAMRRGDVFAAGVAGAPVCDWLDYDTHYTERYLGVPPEDQSAYDVSNVLTYADQLEVPLLIIHGTADDNVYLTHSLKMTDALFRAGKDFEFLPLAGFTHMVTEPAVTRRMYGRIMDFFDANVKGKASQADTVAQ